MPLSLLNTAHRKVMAGHFTGHTQLHASYFCSVLCCTERRGGFQHNVAGLKVKLRITCCWKQIWTMACGRHISHAHVIVTHTCTLYSGSVCDVSPWGQWGRGWQSGSSEMTAHITLHERNFVKVETLNAATSLLLVDVEKRIVCIDA